MYQKNKALQVSKKWVSHTYEVIDTSQNMFAKLQAMLSWQRGYLLTRDQSFFDAFNSSPAKIRQDLEKMLKLTADSPSRNKRMQEIRSNVEKDFILLSDHIRLFNNIGRMKIAMAMETKLLMDEIRRLTDEAITEEKQLLLERTKEEDKAQSNYSNALLFSSLASVLVLLGANWLILYLGGKQKLVEASLKESEDRFQLAINGINDGIFDYNIARDDVYYAPRFKEMLGYKDDEMPNTITAFHQLVHPDDAQKYDEIFNKYANKEIPIYISQIRARHKNGSWRWILIRGAGIWDSSGKLQRLVGTNTDITEQREYEENLKRINKELESFTYIASHDLRSPLVNLKGFASEMQYGIERIRPVVEKALPTLDKQQRDEVQMAISEDIPEAIHFIHSSVQRMDKLTNAILELSRIGRREFRFEKINMRQIVQECINSFQHNISKNGIEIDILDLPEVYSDYIAMEQVMGNILDNAIKYLDPNRKGKIEIGGKQGSVENTYWIKDNGRGIAEADIVKVFEIFRRAGNNGDVPGEGMGMAYVKAMLRRLGGNIWCESRLGQGTAFYFTVTNNS